MLRRHAGPLAFAVLATGLGAALGLWGWPQPHQAVVLAGLILAANLAALFAVRPTVVDDWTIAAPCVVVQFTAMLMLGRDAATLVGAAAAITCSLSPSHRSHVLRGVRHLVTAAAAMQAAGFLYEMLGGTLGGFTWPFAAVPIAAAVLAYCAVECLGADVVTPLLTKQPVSRTWMKRLLLGYPNYLIAASVAAGFAEVIDHRLWQVVPAAAVPLFFAYRAYGAHLQRLDEQHRRDEVIHALEHGMLVVAADGRITLWGDSLQRMFGCPRVSAIGRNVVEVIPALAKTTVLRAIQDAEATGTARMFPAVAVEPRVLEIRIVPVSGGITLLLQDVTQRAQSEQAIKRSEERLSLAADGANDGLWEWDRRTQADATSPAAGKRWSDCQPRPARVVSRTGWTASILTTSRALKLALDAHTRRAPPIISSHEHRLRHEDGTYRRVLCKRGLGSRRRSAG